MTRGSGEESLPIGGSLPNCIKARVPASQVGLRDSESELSSANRLMLVILMHIQIRALRKR